ncbi:MAG TPA: CsbD family protein [Solirubrobacteraceae bacterium]|nr:CsbD family protein [Solirubrobacteraceae bacterium]
MSDGKIDETKGRGKEAVGDLTGDEELKDEGKVDRASGTVKDKVGGVADKAKKMLRKD